MESNISEKMHYSVVLALIISLISTFLLGVLLTEVLWGTGLSYFSAVQHENKILEAQAKIKKVHKIKEIPDSASGQYYNFDLVAGNIIPIPVTAQAEVGVPASFRFLFRNDGPETAADLGSVEWDCGNGITGTDLIDAPFDPDQGRGILFSCTYDTEQTYTITGCIHPWNDQTPSNNCQARIVNVIDPVVVEATTVSTFESIGIYWKPDDGSTSATVRYRTSGGAWQDGHDLYFDNIDDGKGEYNEFRGSLVELDPDTLYEYQITSNLGSHNGIQTASTWSENFPVGNTTILPTLSNSTLTISEGGSSTGYHLYTHAPGGSAEIDVQGVGNCIEVDASYVIIRGLDIKGGHEHCIYFNSGVTDVVIEENTISEWGNPNNSNPDYFGNAIRMSTSGVGRVIIQRNLITDPNNDGESWCENPGHASGVYAIRFKGLNIGNNVVRYNTIRPSNPNANGDGGSNWFQEGISTEKAPGGNNTDVYGNIIEYVWDNGIEIEGSDINMRVWGNRFNHVYRPIATVDHIPGPTYVWRNVLGPNARWGAESCSGTTDDEVDDQGSSYSAGYKIKDEAEGLFIYHETVLHAPPPIGMTEQLRFKHAHDLHSDSDVVARNNIINVHGGALRVESDWDYDLYQGSVVSGQESNGINAEAQYDSGNGFNEFYLAAGSRGVDEGVYIPGFSSGFLGSAPDVGAFERGLPPLEFGKDAYR